MKSVLCGILFHNYLVERELLNAIKKTYGVKCIVFEFPAFPARDGAALLCKRIKESGIRILFTINDFGMDTSDIVGSFLEKRGIIHVNWYVDNPFFSEVMYNKKFPAHRLRLDFVSDRSYVSQLKGKGYNASFLPLGVDPSIFCQMSKSSNYTDEISFVGNSYKKKIDSYISSDYHFFESILPDIHKTASEYRKNRDLTLESRIQRILAQKKLPESLSFEKAVMITSLFIDYLARKDSILMLAQMYPEFMVYGDIGWLQELESSRVSRNIAYYENLAQKYAETKINIDINRIVIKEGFTQRVFDAPASGGFLITSYKPILEEFFVTHGPEKEIVYFTDSKDLIGKIDYYLRNEKERREITQRAAEKILSAHTYRHRVKEIFNRLSLFFSAGSN